MPKPKLVSTPIGLKITGASNFWLQASNVTTGDKVKIEKKDLSAGVWEGSIGNSPGNNKGWKVKVTYNPNPPFLPPGKRRGKKVYAPGDLVVVNITVTNAGGEESDPLEDDVIIE